MRTRLAVRPRAVPALLVAGAALAGLAGCGDIEVRSVAPTEAVPAALEGEWQGSWQSGENSGAGNLTIRIQEFDLHPIVALTINNPCLLPQNYDLVIAGASVALEVNGVAVLEAGLAGPDQLQGTYGCAQDSGSWTATRVGSLPPPLDLSGSWVGSVSEPGGSFEEPLQLQLTQVVRGGALALDGFAELPALLPYPLPVTGYVRFRENDFELTLQSIGGFAPNLVLSGIGDRDPVQVELGLLQVISSQVLPFSQGLFQISQQPQ